MMETQSEDQELFPGRPDLQEKQRQIRPSFEYDILEFLGRSNAAVYLAKRRDTGQKIALKKVAFVASYGNPSPDEMAREFEVFVHDYLAVANLKHRNIVEHIAVEVLHDPRDAPHIGLFMEYCPGGTLFQKSQLLGGFGVSETKRYLKDIVSGLVFLHDNGICHLDFKGDNMLLTENDTVKISDFGEVVKLQFEQTQPHEVGDYVGSAPYMSPEMINKSVPRGRASDVYSLGCLLIEMIEGGRPSFRNTNGADLVDAGSITYYVGQGGAPEIPDVAVTSQDVYLLFKQCIQRRPEFRPTARHVARHPSLRWNNQLLFSEICENDLQELRPVGNGYLSVLNDSGKFYAVRSVDFPAHKDDVANFLDELNILVKVCRNEHPNIMRFYSACLVDAKMLHLEMEHFSKGSLSDLLQYFFVHRSFVSTCPQKFHFETSSTETKNALDAVSQKLKQNTYGSVLTTVHILGLSYQICSGMEYLWKRGVLHLNLCCHNVLFSDELVPKLVSFENAVEVPPDGQTTLKGPYPPPAAFLPPEVKRQENVTSATDVWSYGALLFELFRLGDISGFGWQDPMETSQDPHCQPVFSCSTTEAIFPSRIAAMIVKCLRKNPGRRPTFSAMMTAFEDVLISRCYGFYHDAPFVLTVEDVPSKYRPRTPLADTQNVPKKRRLLQTN